jgi:hypothetical protein
MHAAFGGDERASRGTHRVTKKPSHRYVCTGCGKTGVWRKTVEQAKMGGMQHRVLGYYEHDFYIEAGRADDVLPMTEPAITENEAAPEMNEAQGR